MAVDQLIFEREFQEGFHTKIVYELFNESDSDVFQHNAWDNVEWGEEQENEAQAQVDTVAGKCLYSGAELFTKQSGFFGIIRSQYVKFISLAHI